MNKEDIQILLHNTKIEVKNKEESIEVQNILFRLGFTGASRDGTPINTDKKYLLIYKENDITYTENETKFKNSIKKKLPVEILKKIYEGAKHLTYKINEEVLVRNENEEWKTAKFSHYDEEKRKYAVYTTEYYEQCMSISEIKDEIKKEKDN